MAPCSPPGAVATRSVAPAAVWDPRRDVRHPSPPDLYRR
jgi:hypothetical protein